MEEQYILQLKAEMEDKLTKKLDPLLKKLQKLETLTDQKAKIVAEDKASTTIQKVKGQMSGLGAMKATPDLNVDADDAKNDIDDVKDNLKDITNKDWKAKLIVSAKDKASPVLDKIKSGIAGITKGLALGIAGAVGAGFKSAYDGVAGEQMNKITITRVFKNAGNTQAEAQKLAKDYYKYLEDYSMKTPFTPAEMANFGTKAAQMEKGNLGESKKTAEMMANVQAFRSDRTADEIADAFFSASTGQMDALNNMLGTSYQSWKEAKEGISQDMNGLVDEMSQTLPGAVSTLQGVLQQTAKTVFAPVMDALPGMLSTLSTKLLDIQKPVQEYFAQHKDEMAQWGTDISELAGQVGEALAPVREFLFEVFDSIMSRSPEAQAMFEIFGTAVVVVAELLGTAFEVLSQVYQQVMDYIAQNQESIQGFIEILGLIGKAFLVVAGILGGAILQAILLVMTVIGDFKVVFDDFANLWERRHEIMKQAIEKLKEKVRSCIDTMKTKWQELKDKIENMVEKIKGYWESLKSVFSKPIEGVVNIAKNFLGGGDDDNSPRHAYGLNRVPKDDYPVRLHQGEKVLTRTEADRYDGKASASGVVINKLADTIVVREEADIDKIVTEINRKIEIELAGGVA